MIYNTFTIDLEPSSINYSVIIFHVIDLFMLRYVVILDWSERPRLWTRHVEPLLVCWTCSPNWSRGQERRAQSRPGRRSCLFRSKRFLRGHAGSNIVQKQGNKLYHWLHQSMYLKIILIVRTTNKMSTTDVVTIPIQFYNITK